MNKNLREKLRHFVDEILGFAFLGFFARNSCNFSNPFLAGFIENVVGKFSVSA